MAQRAASYGEAVLHKSLTMKHCFRLHFITPRQAAKAPQYEASPVFISLRRGKPFHSDMKHFAYAPYDVRKWEMRTNSIKRKSHTLVGMMENQDESEIIFRHRTFQRMLQPYVVVNPFADKLFYEDGRLQARRDQPKFLNLCNAVAFLNQMKKQVKRYKM